MKRLLSSLLLMILAGACAAPPEPPAPPVEDVQPPPMADAHAYLSLVLGPSLPVILVESPILAQGYLGQSWREPDHYVLLVDPSLDAWAQHAVLIHEWAHILVWEQGLDAPALGHGVEWGEAYATVFRAWAGEE